MNLIDKILLILSTEKTNATRFFYIDKKEHRSKMRRKTKATENHAQIVFNNKCTNK